jgi:hypothetical protein
MKKTFLVLCALLLITVCHALPIPTKNQSGFTDIPPIGIPPVKLNGMHNKAAMANNSLFISTDGNYLSSIVR